jgi:hypothetical protein
MVLTTLMLGVFSSMLTGIAVAGDATTTVNFVIGGDPASAFRDIKISEELADGTAQPLTETSPGKFLVTVPHTFDGYYLEKTFDISVDRPDNFVWPVNFKDIDFSLTLEIRKGIPRQFTIPINIPDEIGVDEMARLERMTKPSELFNKYVQAGIIFNHFRNNIGAKDPYSRRILGIWFNAAFTLATAKTGRSIVMGDEIHQAVKDSFGDDAAKLAQFEKSITESQSLRLGDLNELPAVIADDGCDIAKEMIDAVTTLSTDRPELLTLRSVTATHVADRLKQWQQSCQPPGPVAASP